MLLQPSIAPSPQRRSHAALSSCLAYAPPLPSGAQTVARSSAISFRRSQVSCSSISMVHTYGTTDYENRPMQKWNVTYRKISLMENNSDASAAQVLSQAESEGKRFTKWELCKIVKELRKYRRFRLALEVYEWMNYRGERYRLVASDAAIQLDLISKVKGIPNAEEFFQKLPDTLKDNRIYGSLLNAYAQARMKENAEALMDNMRNKGYAYHPLPFNVMMTLYMNLKEYDKVDALVAEMMQKKVQLDIYTYNIWLSSCGSRGSMEKMEKVFAQMKTDRTCDPNWTTYSTMATMYTNQGQIEKAEECLRMVEAKIAGRDRIPYHYLISLYGSVGNRDELFRIWNIYIATFPTILNMGYHAMVSSLVRIGDIDGAEEMHQQWLKARATYDPRLPNLLMQWYVRNGQLNKATEHLDRMTEAGGIPNSNTWEILAEGYILERRIQEAMSCLKDAFNAEGAMNWKPKPALLTAFINLCGEEADTASKEVLVELLRQRGHLENQAYKSVFGSTDGSPTGNESEKEDDDDDESVELHLNQLDSTV
uniref:Pentatricopeptide repeat-containing protein n=1 Tax=Kalanchoe fedtschenkoi TaxID=63787 RepID=A0A7N0T0B1_KALFE